jgi:hypothetical protein
MLVLYYIISYHAIAVTQFARYSEGAAARQAQKSISEYHQKSPSRAWSLASIDAYYTILALGISYVKYGSARGLAAASQFALRAHPTRRLRRGRINARPRKPECRDNRFAIQSRPTVAWSGGIRLRQRRFSAIGLSACCATPDTKNAFASHERHETVLYYRT